MAFIILGLESPAGAWPARVEVRVEGMTTSPREWLLALVRGGDLEDVAVGVAHEQPALESKGAIFHLHDAV